MWKQREKAGVKMRDETHTGKKSCSPLYHTACTRMSHVGFSDDEASTREPTMSVGNLLIRFAPERTAKRAVLDMPDRPDIFDRTDPVSEMGDWSPRKILGGGAKSRAVNVPDLRSA